MIADPHQPDHAMAHRKRRVLRPTASTLIALLNLYRADDETRHKIADLWEEAKNDGAPQPFAPDLRDEYNA